MNSRRLLMISLLNLTVASSATATAAGSAVDLADYFPVGKREIKFVLASVIGLTTSTGFTATMTVQECDSTSTASFTNVTGVDGSTVTKTNTDGTSFVTEFHGFVTKRYIRVLYNMGQATTGFGFALTALAFPLVREQ